MEITAKYSSVCPTCKTPIKPGDKIIYKPGKPARHATCAPPEFFKDRPLS